MSELEQWVKVCQHKASVNTGIFPVIYFDPNINFVLEKA